MLAIFGEKCYFQLPVYTTFLFLKQDSIFFSEIETADLENRTRYSSVNCFRFIKKSKGPQGEN